MAGCGRLAMNHGMPADRLPDLVHGVETFPALPPQDRKAACLVLQGGTGQRILGGSQALDRLKQLMLKPRALGAHRQCFQNRRAAPHIGTQREAASAATPRETVIDSFGTGRRSGPSTGAVLSSANVADALPALSPATLRATAKLERPRFVHDKASSLQPILGKLRGPARASQARMIPCVAA